MNRFRWNILVGVIIMVYGLFEVVLSFSEGRMVRVTLAAALSLIGVVHLLTIIRSNDQ